MTTVFCVFVDVEGKCDSDDVQYGLNLFDTQEKADEFYLDQFRKFANDADIQEDQIEEHEEFEQFCEYVSQFEKEMI